MQPDSPFRLVEALGSSQVGSVWSAVDLENRPLTVAVLDASVALDQQWRDAFAAAANEFAQPQAGGPRVLYTDFAAPSPWVACSADGGPGAEQVFLVLGVTYQPVPPDFDTSAAPVAPSLATTGTPDADVAADSETTQPTEKIPVEPLTPINPWAAPPSPISPPPGSLPPQEPAGSAPTSQSAPPESVSAPPAAVSGAPFSVSGAPHSVSGPPQQMSVPPHVVSSVPMSPSMTPHSPAYGPAAPDGPSLYPPYYPTSSAPPARPPRRRTGLWVGIGTLVLLLIAGGGIVFALRDSGDKQNPQTTTPTTGTATAPLPTASPLLPGLEPARAGAWPAGWPRFGPADRLKTLPNLEGLGFPLKVPLAWDCAPGGQAQGYAKYNCGVSPGENPQIGGELIVRNCGDSCSESAQTTMRQSEEAWGLQWIKSGPYASYAESSSLQIDGVQRYGLVIVAYWRGSPSGEVDRQVVLRMTAPVEGAGQVRRVANYLRDTLLF